MKIGICPSHLPDANPSCGAAKKSIKMQLFGLTAAAE
jgi:hypothetical protein